MKAVDRHALIKDFTAHLEWTVCTVPSECSVYTVFSECSLCMVPFEYSIWEAL